MQPGAILGPVQGDDPRSLADQARQLEQEGFGSLWAVQTVGRGFMFPDPLLALAVAASVTDTVRLGTAVLQVPLYHPMDLAHRVFSLQQTCGDRLILGVGAGSTEADFNAYGRDYGQRFRQLDDSVSELRTIFASGGNGTSDLSPWPSVRGGPSVYLGSWGKGVGRAAREYDGWIASANYRTVDEIEVAAARYRALGGGASVVSTIQVNGKTDPGELREKLVRFDEAGFDDAVFLLQPDAPPPSTLLALFN